MMEIVNHLWFFLCDGDGSLGPWVPCLRQELKAKGKDAAQWLKDGAEPAGTSWNHGPGRASSRQDSRKMSIDQMRPLHAIAEIQKGRENHLGTM